MKEIPPKNMEIDSIHVYVMIMRKMLLNNLGLLLALGLLLSPQTGTAGLNGVSALLKFSEQAPFPEHLSNLKAQGVRIKQAAAPSLVIAEFPASVSPGGFPGVLEHFLGPVEVDQFSSMGPLATALAQRWNHIQLQRAGEDTGLFGALSTIVRANNLPKPSVSSLSPEGRILSYDLTPVLTADIYEVQLSLYENFSTVAFRSYLTSPSGKVPLPSGITQNFYFRARALEKDRRENNELFLSAGEWGEPQLISYGNAPLPSNHPAPVLTSPLEGQNMEGFTVILEWDTHPASSFRVQFSENAHFQSPVLDQYVTEQNLAVPALAMEVGKTYFWRVAPWDQSTGPWSGTRSLTIREPRHIGADMFVNPEAPR